MLSQPSALRAVTRAPGVFALARRARGAPRLAAHVACWAPFASGAVLAIRGRWVATSDNAAIALRSWSVLSGHAPLLGQATRLATGLYDPGPLEYWLLALPVRADPAHGLLWGAALWCMLACSLVVEAAFSVAGAGGALLAAGVALGAVCWIPKIAAVASWNPWFGMMCLLAALAASLAVMAGRRWWWPAAVVAGSAAAQAHLMFAIASAAIVLLSLCAGLAGAARSKSPRWWAAAGLAAGLACWSAPLIQEMTHRSGNLTALATEHGASGGAGGAAFGLKALAAAAVPPPMWWRPLGSLTQLNLVNSRSAATGVVVLAVLAVVLVVSVRPLRDRAVASLAALSLAVSLSAAVTYAGIPAAALDGDAADLRYLMAPMFAVGVSCWLAIGSAAALAALRAGRRARGGQASAGIDVSGQPPSRDRLPGPAWLASVAGLAGVAALVAASAAAVALTAQSQRRPNPMMGAVAAASSRIERALPAQPIALTVVGPYAPDRRRLTLGLAYALAVLGYRPEVTYSYWAHQLGGYYVFRHAAVPRVTVSLWGSGVAVTVGSTPGRLPTQTPPTQTSRPSRGRVATSQ